MEVSARLLDGYQVELNAGRHTFYSDEPVSVGGTDIGPNPYGLLLAALASCKLITVRMYAERKGWPLESINITLANQKVHADDCEDCMTEGSVQVDVIESTIEFIGDLTNEQLERLAEISQRCPVERTLTSETVIRTSLVKKVMEGD